MPPEHPDPELLAAIAAGERPDAATASHLEGCEPCTVTLRELGDVTRRLGLLGTPTETPGEEVWERVRGAALDADADPGAVPLRPVPTPVPAAGAPRRRVALAAVAGLAAGLVLGAVGIRLATPDPGGPDDDAPAAAEPGVVVARADLAPLTGDGPRGSASLVRGPERARLWVELPSGGGGDVPRQVWLLDDRADVVAVGLLGDGQAGVFDVPLDVIESHQVVDVSAEPLDGDPAHSGDTLFRGALVAG
jgi:hypothetical protein